MRKEAGKVMEKAANGAEDKAMAAEASGKRRLAGQEILAAMNALDDELVEILPLAEDKKKAGEKAGTARWMRWAVAAVCSLCLVGGSVALAASNLSWHTRERADLDRDENEPPMSDYWVEYGVQRVSADAFTGAVRDVEKIFKEEAENGIYPQGEDIPRGWVEIFDTEEEAVDYVGYEGLRRTAPQDWTTWHIQLAVYGNREGDLTKVVVNAQYKLDQYKVGKQNRLVAQVEAEIYTEDWMSGTRTTSMPFYNSENVQGQEYQTKNGKTGLVLDPEYDGEGNFWMEGYMIEGSIVYSLRLRYNGLIGEKGLAEEAVREAMYEWMEQF